MSSRCKALRAYRTCKERKVNKATPHIFTVRQREQSARHTSAQKPWTSPQVLLSEAEARTQETTTTVELRRAPLQLPGGQGCEKRPGWGKAPTEANRKGTCLRTVSRDPENKRPYTIPPEPQHTGRRKGASKQGSEATPQPAGTPARQGLTVSRRLKAPLVGESTLPEKCLPNCT